MFGATVKTVDNFKAVKKSADKALKDLLRKATFRIFQNARASILEQSGPSAPGTPPHTHSAGVIKATKRSRTKKSVGSRKLGVLPRSIRYAVDVTKKEGYVGPTAHDKGLFAYAHEFGGDRPDTAMIEHYPERAFMKPALEREAPEFARSFAGSIGQ